MNGGKSMNNSAEKSPIHSLTIDLDLPPRKDKTGALVPLHCHVEKEKTAKLKTGEEIFTFSFSVLKDLSDDRLSFLTDGFSVRVHIRFQG